MVGTGVGGTPKTTLFRGQRHFWSASEGWVAPEVLDWLRGDPALDPSTDEFRAQGLSFVKGEEQKGCTRTEFPEAPRP